MYKLREFTGSDKDYADLEQIEREVWPDCYETADEFRHMDKTDMLHRFGRIYAEVANQTVAHATYMETHWSASEGEYFFHLRVRPEFQQQGIGAALYDHMRAQLVAAQIVAPQKLVTETREDKPHAMRFLEKRGFTISQRAPVSHLEVQAFDASPYAGLAPKMETQGVKIVSLTELAAIEPNWQHKVWEMRYPIRLDVPSIFEKKQQPFDEFVSERLGAPQHRDDAYFVAIGPDDEYIGWSALHTSEADPTKLYTSMTGVKREWRRKGVATALKLRAIAWAKAYSATIIETDNEENNPMYDLNMQLGFKPQPAWLGYELKLAA